MSLQSNLHKETETTVRLRAGNFAFVVRRVLAPLLLQMKRDQQARRVAENRRNAAQEIDALPASLHQDVAFSHEANHNNV